VSLATFHAHIDAFNARDIDRLMVGFAPDARWLTGGYAVSGHPDLRAFFTAAMDSLLPTLHVRAVVADGKTVAAELIERFTFDSAAKIAHIAGFYRFREELIISASIYREGSADPGQAPGYHPPTSRGADGGLRR